MKCPKCNYTSFDHLNQCSKCGLDLLELREECGFSSDKAVGIDILKYTKSDNVTTTPVENDIEGGVGAENETIDGSEEEILSDDDSMDILLEEETQAIQDDSAAVTEDIETGGSEPMIEAADATEEETILPEDSTDIELTVDDETVTPQVETGGIELPADFDSGDEIELVSDDTANILPEAEGDEENFSSATEDSGEIELSLDDGDLAPDEPDEIELAEVSDINLEDISSGDAKSPLEEVEEITLDDLGLEPGIKLEEDEGSTE